MLVIRLKEAYKNCACENGQKDKAFSVERLSDLALDTNVPNNLQLSSNDRSDSARVTGDQIARSDSSSDVTGIRKVTSVGSGGIQNGMASRGWGSEGDNFPLRSKEGEGPLGVNSLDRFVGDIEAENYILNDNTLVTNLNPGNPENKVNRIGNQRTRWQGLDRCNHRDLNSCDCVRPDKHQKGGNTEPFTENRLKNHTVSTLGVMG